MSGNERINLLSLPPSPPFPIASFFNMMCLPRVWLCGMFAFKLCSMVAMGCNQPCYQQEFARPDFGSVLSPSPSLCPSPTDFFFWVAKSHTNLCSPHFALACNSHLYRQFNDYRGYKLDHTGPQMILTMKLTSWAFNVYDGRRNPKVYYPDYLLIFYQEQGGKDRLYISLNSLVQPRHTNLH